MRATLALGLSLIAGPALSETIPRLDIEEICRGASVFSRRAPGTVQERYDLCFTAQQADYDALKAAWRHISETEQRACLDLQRGDPSYGSLRRCAEQTIERNDAEAPSPVRKREFRY